MPQPLPTSVRIRKHNVLPSISSHLRNDTATFRFVNKSPGNGSGLFLPGDENPRHISIPPMLRATMTFISDGADANAVEMKKKKTIQTPEEQQLYRLYCLWHCLVMTWEWESNTVCMYRTLLSPIVHLQNGWDGGNSLIANSFLLFSDSFLSLSFSSRRIIRANIIQRLLIKCHHIKCTLCA